MPHEGFLKGVLVCASTATDVHRTCSAGPRGSKQDGGQNEVLLPKVSSVQENNGIGDTPQFQKPSWASNANVALLEEWDENITCQECWKM